MMIRLIVNIGIISLIVAGCASSPLMPQSAKELSSVAAATGQVAAPKALTALSCSSGQRIVIAALPVRSPVVLGIKQKRWWSDLVVLKTSRVGQLALLALPSDKDLTPEFRESIGAMLQDVDLQQLLLARAEQIIKPRSSCYTAFLPTTLDDPAAFNSSDRVVVIKFYFSLTGNQPVLWSGLSALVMTGENAAELAKRSDEFEKIMDEMKKLEPYVLVYDRRPDLDKLKQYVELAQKLKANVTPYIDESGMVNYTSPGHSTDEWLANDGAAMTKEIAAVMDRLIGDVAGILFK